VRFVHIAGTNGKGSTAAYISSIITAAGQRCGCFTSPHLVSETERFRIDGRPIGADTLDALLAEVKDNQLAVNDTLFAAYTASALLWFAREGVDWAVMEVGLGGRLDPTNAIQPDITVLTAVSVDHTDVLGSRLEDIAAEKCGIIKPGVPVVLAKQHTAVQDIITAHCENVGSLLSFVGDVEIMSQTLKGQAFKLEGGSYTISEIGQAQPQNAALAVLACRTLGFNEASIEWGLAATVLAARTQYIAVNPDMLLDGAHNPAAAAMLSDTLDQYFSDRKRVLLFACMQNKDHKGITEALGGHFDCVITTRVDEKRGAKAIDLCRLFSQYAPCETETNPQLAFDKARAIAVRKDALLVVSGSLYLAGAVLHRL